MRRALLLVCLGALAGCGSSHSAATPTATATAPTVESATCESSSQAGQPASQACTLVLSDGERFSCQQPFTGPPPTAGQLEHAGCRRVAPLRLSATERTLIARLDRTRSCLAARHLRVLGGAVLPPNPPDSTQPDGEVVISSAHPAFVGFYTDAARAQRLAPAIARAGARTHAQIERRGAATVVWTITPTGALRDAVRSCLSS